MMIGGYLNNIEPAVHTFEVTYRSELSANRWKYVVRPVSVQLLNTDDATFEHPNVPAYFSAWNIFEIGNSASSAMGIDPSTLPGTYELKPISNGTVVPGFYTQGEGRMVVLLFWPNQFDGACE